MCSPHHVDSLTLHTSQSTEIDVITKIQYDHESTEYVNSIIIIIICVCMCVVYFLCLCFVFLCSVRVCVYSFLYV